ncbi:BtpA/SgcQ family protein [Youxingia wuxianensis]|uniref:BtpA/SgcQ family protein n=1 Tax=Youxingia wuxianensis TaxID=2763678 RepID=A0A926ER85_9FIRM|nr:BtpA/SgcQ family protein [Youxingia wuxianensis]MBC8585172.1 BtpA/SgcQ family protein [Youxingia wuxianensis]
MSWRKEMFGVNKPIIALLHLGALPSDPKFKRGTPIKQVIDEARKDLHALQDGGVDGVLFSNEFSMPYQSNVEMVVPITMGRIIGELRSEIKVPFGVECEADPMATIDLAAAVEANFTRGTYTGGYVGDGGIVDTDIATLLRRKWSLGLDNLRMLYFLNNESDEYLVPANLPAQAQAIIFNCEPDAFCISGANAGIEANSDWITQVRDAIDRQVPVFANTGCRAENIKEKLAISDGACVGTAFKIEGKFKNHVDPARVKEFMEKVREYRAENKDA